MYSWNGITYVTKGVASCRISYLVGPNWVGTKLICSVQHSLDIYKAELIIMLINLQWNCLHIKFNGVLTAEESVVS